MVIPTARFAPPCTTGTISLVVNGQLQHYRLSDPTTFGSSPDCQIRLQGPDIEPVHGGIRREGGGWCLEVEPHADPVALNGFPVRFARLAPGDRVALGDFEVFFESHHVHQIGSERRVEKPDNGPSRASVQELAAQLTALDLEWVRLETQRETWLAEIDREKRLLEKQSDAFEQRQIELERSWSIRRQTAFEDIRKAQAQISEQRALIQEKERELNEQASAVAQAHRVHSDEAARLSASARAQQKKQAELERSAQRLLTTAQQAARSIVEESAAEKARLDMSRKERDAIEQDLQVRRIELEAIEQRVARQRSILDRTTSMPTATPSTPAASSTFEEAEQLSRVLEGLTRSLEPVADEIEETQRVQQQERVRLAHWERSLRVREDEMSGARMSRWLAMKEKVERDRQELAAEQDRWAREKSVFLTEQARWAAEKSSWDRMRTLEKGVLESDWQRIRAVRRTLVMKHRHRSGQLREQRKQLKDQQRRLAERIGYLLRLEANMGLVYRRVCEERLATMHLQLKVLEATPGRARHIDHWRGQLAAQNEHIRQEHQELKLRLEKGMAQLLMERKSRSNAPNGMTSSEECRMKLAMQRLQTERDILAADHARQQAAYESQVQTLKEQVERLAASLLQPTHGTSAEQVVVPRRVA